MKAMAKSNLSEFWRKKELEWGRIIPVSEVAKETHLDWETVNHLKAGDTTRFDSHVIGRICRYFEIPEGAPVPFLIVQYGETAK